MIVHRIDGRGGVKNCKTTLDFRGGFDMI